MRGHKVALSGSYSGNTEQLFNGLTHSDILQFSLVGREVTLQVKSENLDAVKKTLKRLGVDNIGILEWRKYGMSLANSGAGSDDKEVIMVSLIPTALGEGITALAALYALPLDDETIMLLQTRVEEILEDSGITDTLYTLQIKKDASKDSYVKAVEIATLNAIFDSGGIVSVE